MLIAISGTHSLGKSTMVDDFLESHPDYIHELEPYRALRDDHDMKFAKESTKHCFEIQIEYTIERMKRYGGQGNAIFDRCIADLVPYAQYTAHYGQSDLDNDFVEWLAKRAKESLHYLDLIVFLPITEKHIIELEDDNIRPTNEDYQIEVDEYFKKMYRDHSFDILPENNPPKIVELWGPRDERIKKLDALL